MEKQQERKVQFRELSGWLKTAVIFAWIYGAYIAIAFIVGFIEGMILS